MSRYVLALVALALLALAGAPRTAHAQAGGAAPLEVPPQEITAAPPATEPPPGASAATGSAGAQSASLPIALVDCAPISPVDTAAGTFVTEVLREALVQQGHTTVPLPQLYDVARRLQLPFPVPAEGLAELLRQLAVPVGVTAELRAGGGYYQATLRVRFASEPSERYRQILATQWTLGDSIRAALPALLAPAGTASYASGDLSGIGDLGNVQPPPRPRPVQLHPYPFMLGGGVDLAFGPGQDSFFNFVGFVRAAYYPLDRLGLSASVGYANLRGRAERVSNVLAMAGIETAVEIAPRQKIFLPLRAEVGYLPLNGPVLRATAGLTFTLTRSIQIEFDVLSPTVWIVPGTAAVSLDLGVQLLFGAGGARTRRRR